MVGEQESRTDPSTLTVTLSSPKEEEVTWGCVEPARKAQASFQDHC